MTIEKLLDEHLEHLIVSALEGGSNHWYYIGSEETLSVIGKYREEGDEPFSGRVFRAVEAGEKLAIHDKETGDLMGFFTKESALNALKTISAERLNVLGRIIDGGYDAEDADVWFQIAVMGKVTFG